ncbi:hypothetical protein pSALSNUABM04_095 [Salmonella phage pSal-SNUABM-04]|nr:hypothetical protein pSALSNUABM04_095 [Salmonella phage pSal-SNUABM-04]
MMRIVAAFILTVISFTVSANFNPYVMEGFKPSNPGDVRVKFTELDNPTTVAEHGGFAVVNTGRSEKCPAGGFYLVNLTRKTYQFVDAGSCQKDIRVSLSGPYPDKLSVVTEILTFTYKDIVTARYPLYSY